MECAVITTYRCNAKCQMCHTWKYPSKVAEEFNPQILERLPTGMKRLNITGGEPLYGKTSSTLFQFLKKKQPVLRLVLTVILQTA